jgi:salicylate hydroxylase
MKSPEREKPAKSRTILVSGGGIAGLTVAALLAKKGFRVDVFEQAENFDPIGAGIQLSANALRILDDLGIGKQLRLTATAPLGIRIMESGYLWRLANVPLGAEAIIRHGLPYLTIHRSDLHQCLLAACARDPDINIHNGSKITDITYHQNGTSALVSTRDGISTRRGLAVICADGVKSRNRTDSFGEGGPVHSGFEAWRAMVPIDLMPRQFDMEYTNLVLATGAHAVLYPVSNGRYVNVVVIAKTASRNFETRHKADIAPLRKQLRSWNRNFKSILDAPLDWSIWPVLKASRTGKWHEGPLVMIGDAAHAMVPFAAQGAAMAIEDAAVLANCMDTKQEVEPAFEKFEKLRRKRIKKVASLSENNGRIYHMGFPLNVFRDMIMTLTPPKRLLQRQAWIYDWKP